MWGLQNIANNLAGGAGAGGDNSEPEVEDGWDDDEDGGFDDDGLDDDNFETESGTTSELSSSGDDPHHQQHEHHEHEQHGQQHYDRPPAVGGMLMGRLTRFLEQVAQPEDEDETEDDEATRNSEQQQQQQQQVADGWDGDDLVVDDQDPSPPPPPPPVVVSSDNNGVASNEHVGNALGWNESSSGIIMPNNMQQQIDNNSNNAWNDDDDDVDVDDDEDAFDFGEVQQQSASDANDDADADSVPPMVSEQVSQASIPLDHVLNEIDAMNNTPPVSSSRVRHASRGSQDSGGGFAGSSGAVSEDDRSRDQHHYDQAVRDIQQEMQHLEQLQQGGGPVIRTYVDTRSTEEEEHQSEGFLTPQNMSALSSTTDGFVDAGQQDDDNNVMDVGGGGDGWDDDDVDNLDLSGTGASTEPEQQQTAETTAAAAAAAAAVMEAASPTPPTTNGNDGWAEDDVNVDDLDLSAAAEAPNKSDELVVQETPAAAQPAVVVPEATGDGYDGADGWADDDVDLDICASAGADDGKVVAESNNTAVASLAETTPAPATKEDTDGWADDDVDLDLSGSAGAEDDDTKKVVAPSSAETPAATIEAGGWADDVVDLDLSAGAEADEVVDRSTPATAQQNHITGSRPPQRSQSQGSDDTPVVDHTPAAVQQRAEEEEDPSLAPQVAPEDRTRFTGPEQEDEVLYDDENEDAYGPIVDHTPKSSTKPIIQLSRQDSLAVQAAPQDIDTVDDDLDDQNEQDIDDGDTRDSDLPGVDNLLVPNGGAPPEPSMVDHTPADDSVQAAKQRRSGDLSIDVVPSAGDTIDMEADDGKDMDAAHEYGPVVDHTPQNERPVLALAPMSGSQSMAVTAPALEDDIREDEAMDESVDDGDGSTLKTSDVATGVGDGWDVDETDIEGDDDEVSSPLSSLQASETKPPPPPPRERQQHVVDHTPDGEAQDRPEAYDPSVTVLATVDDLTRDTGSGNDEDVYDDENELDYVPVVDHTPSVGASATVTSSRLSVNSLVVHASTLDEDFQEHDAMEETCFGDSTIAGGTLDGAATLDGAPDGWDQDDVNLETIAKDVPREETMVDQTPSEMGSPTPVKNADPSVAVLASIDENDSVEEDHAYGPVVDQTPTTPAPGQGRSDSVIVQAADQETVDETLVDGGSTDEDNDGDTIDDELPSALRSPEDKLVDHVPARPESRFGDASTLVAADPSEIMSEVDDMAQEEGDFGPVVDVTPLTRPAAQAATPSGAGSTAVFASPSVAIDDLDDADETEGDADETEVNMEDGWGEEKAPNPQSGNDEPVETVNEQLVDFLPPQDEQPAQDHGETSTGAPDVESELTVRGADSLLQAEDTKEDDFGPVVDLTPIPRIAVAQSAISNTSTATQVTASEISRLEKEDKSESRSVDLEQGKSDNAVVDHVPQMRERLAVDSLATAARSQLSEEDDEEEENDSKFGPVVDHLPTPRNSLAPSRGGSTVDALATVSEVRSDDEEDNGWENDLDLDASEAASERTDKMSQPQSANRGFFRRMGSGDHDKGMSVRFDASVRDGRPIHEASRSPGSSERQFFDADSSTQNDSESGWGGMQPNESLFPTSSFADADTPPSTPHQRPSNGKRSGRNAPVNEQLLQPSDSQLERQACPTCARAKSLECPCVQRLIEVTKKNGSMLGTLITPEGESIQVNFGKLLEEEVAKRNLVEEETKALRSAVESRKLESAAEESKEAELEEELAQMRQSNDYFLERIESVQAEASALREENSRLTDDLANARHLVDKLEESKTAWATKQTAWEAEIETLKRALSDASTRLSSEEGSSSQVVALRSELSLKNGECHQLNVQVAELQQSLQTAEDSAGRNGREVESLSEKLQEESSRFRDLRDAHSQLQERAQERDEGKKEAVRKLEASEMELQSTRNENEALSSKLATAQEHARASEEAKKEAQSTMSAAKIELQRVHAEKEALSKRLIDMQVQHETDIKTQYELLDKKANDAKTLEDRLKAAEDEKAELAVTVSRDHSLAEEAEKLASELLSVAKERDLLQEALAESKDAVVSLQRHIDEHGMEHEALESKRAEEITTLTAEVKRLQESIRAKDLQSTELSTRLSSMEQDRTAMDARTQELETECSSLKTSLEDAKLLVSEEESKAERARAELESLRTDFDDAQHKLDTVESERAQWSTQIDQLDRELQSARGDCQLQSVKIGQLETELQTSRDQISSLTSGNASLVSEKQRLETSFRELESSSTSALAEAKSHAEELTRRHTEELHASNVECEHLRQEVESQKSCDASELENVRLQLDEITKERNTLSFEKEEMLVQFGLLNGQLDASVAQLEAVENETNTLQLLMKALVENKNSTLHPDDIPDLSVDNLKIVEAINGLRESNAELENEVERLSADKETAEAGLGELQSVVEQLQLKCETIGNAAVEKDQQIEALQDQLGSSTSDNERFFSELQGRIEQLELESSEKDNLMEAKDTELSAALARLEYGDQATRELQELNHKMREKEEETDARASRIKELEERCALMESELVATKDQLATTKAALDAGVSNQQVSSVVARYESRNNELEVEIKEKASRISQLERSVDELQLTSAQLAVEQGKAQDEEIRSLRDKLESLQNALHETRDRVTSKEEIVSRLTAELRHARDKELETASAVLQNGGDKSEDVDSLRSHVVSLAVALERSENRRAEALDTLLTEREANAGRLRQLGESLKRYYETVSS